MERTFYKLHGIGNDYIYFDCMEEPLKNPDALAVRLSDRRFSVGGDGVITVGPSEKADAFMRIYNADGSEGKMCGNGIRCVGKFLYEIKKIQKEELTVETLSGVKTLHIEAKNGEVLRVSVDMGEARLAPAEIPARFEGEKIVDHPAEFAGEEYRITCVSMGNPHCVVFVNDPYDIDIESVGSAFENDERFPERVNTEFVKFVGRNELLMRVWERGSGETWACGTGACAAAVAAVLCGYCEEGEEITVHLRGGDLVIVYEDGAVTMTGPAAFAFTGTVKI